MTIERYRGTGEGTQGGRGALRVLLLGGAGEARPIAQALAGMPGVEATLSLARRERVASETRLPVRIGGFGGDAAFAAWLRERRIAAVIDASHPFAASVSRRTATVCRTLGVHHLQVLRPPWQPGPEDRWIDVDSLAEAAERIPDGARIFVATGRARLDDAAALGRHEVIVRRLAPTSEPFPYPRGAFRVDRPPFTAAGEAALFRQLGVDWLVVHNAGGAGGWPKLEAARMLGLPVAMIRRPPQPDAPRVETPAEAVDWVRALA